MAPQPGSHDTDDPSFRYSNRSSLTVDSPQVLPRKPASPASDMDNASWNDAQIDRAIMQPQHVTMQTQTPREINLPPFDFDLDLLGSYPNNMYGHSGDTNSSLGNVQTMQAGLYTPQQRQNQQLLYQQPSVSTPPPLLNNDYAMPANSGGQYAGATKFQLQFGQNHHSYQSHMPSIMAGRQNQQIRGSLASSSAFSSQQQAQRQHVAAMYAARLQLQLQSPISQPSSSRMEPPQQYKQQLPTMDNGGPQPRKHQQLALSPHMAANQPSPLLGTGIQQPQHIQRASPRPHPSTFLSPSPATTAQAETFMGNLQPEQRQFLDQLQWMRQSQTPSQAPFPPTPPLSNSPRQPSYARQIDVNTISPSGVGTAAPALRRHKSSSSDLRKDSGSTTKVAHMQLQTGNQTKSKVCRQNLSQNSPPQEVSFTSKSRAARESQYTGKPAEPKSTSLQSLQPPPATHRLHSKSSSPHHPATKTSPAQGLNSTATLQGSVLTAAPSTPTPRKITHNGPPITISQPDAEADFIHPVFRSLPPLSKTQLATLAAGVHQPNKTPSTTPQDHQQRSLKRRRESAQQISDERQDLEGPESAANRLLEGLAKKARLEGQVLGQEWAYTIGKKTGPEYHNGDKAEECRSCVNSEISNVKIRQARHDRFMGRG